MSLAQVTLIAILSLVRAPAADAVRDSVHLEALADAIAGAVIDADDLASWIPDAGAGTTDEVLPLPFRGAGARVATALALAALAFHESRFDPRVTDCRIVGKDHPSISAWQLWGPMSRGLYTRRELCASPRKAAERALWVLSHHARRGGRVRRWFDGYASGGRPTKAGRIRCETWERLAKDAGLVGAQCWRRGAIIRAANAPNTTHGAAPP